MSIATTPDTIPISESDPVAERTVLTPEAPPALPDTRPGLDEGAAAEHLDAARPVASQRLMSLDAYRGLVMVLMISAGLGIPRVVKSFEQNPSLYHLKTPLWERLAYQTEHTDWIGCSLWDLIQPSFMFMVGAAVAFSVASRRAKGQSFSRMLVHAIWRSIALVLLAVFLTSSWSAKTEWIFTNVLAQIGLGYTFLFLVAWLKPRWQLATAAAILVLYWGAFAVYPKPPADTDPAKVHLPADWPRLQGFASHWEKHTNLAARFDGWFLNLFPHYDKKGATRIRYEYNEGGYTTLNFVPSLATMILGLLAGELIRSRLKSAAKFGILLAAGLAGLGLGWLFLHQLAWICPVVKRIWTPTWVIHSAGWAFLLLAVFFLVIDVIRIRFWAMPLVWVGMNSIAAYCMSQLLKPWFRENMQRHFGKEVFNAFGHTWSPITETAFFLLIVWAACWWMYRKKFFVKI